MCTLLLIRGATESAMVNTVMVLHQARRAGDVLVIAFTALQRRPLRRTSRRSASPAVGAAAGTIFFSYIGLDAVSTAGDEVKDPQKTMPRAIIAALLIVTGVYVLVPFAALGAQDWERVRGPGRRARRRSSTTSPAANYWSTVLAAGAVISIFSVTLVTMYGQTRILFAMGRDGLLPSMFAKVNPKSMTPVNNTIIVAIVRRACWPASSRWTSSTDMVSIGTLTAFIVVSIGVIILRGARTRSAARFQGAAVPGHADPLDRWRAATSCTACTGTRGSRSARGCSSCWAFYLLWGRHHSALNDGGDGVIATAAPGVDDVEIDARRLQRERADRA